MANLEGPANCPWSPSRWGDRCRRRYDGVEYVDDVGDAGYAELVALGVTGTVHDD